MKTKLFVLGFFISFTAYSQYQRKNKPLFPKPPQYRNSFYTFSGGATYLLPWWYQKQHQSPLNSDTILKSNILGKGKVGGHLSIGKYHFLDKLYFFEYLDYGISYTSWRGNQSHSDSLIITNNSLNIRQGSNSFSYHQIGAYFKIHNVKQLSDNRFLQNSIGFDLSYDFITNRSNTDYFAIDKIESNNPFRAAIYYQIGFGFKLNKLWFIIPSIDIPLVWAHPFDNFSGEILGFNSKLRPIIFKLQFLVFKAPKPKACPPVKSIGVPDGMNPADMK